MTYLRQTPGYHNVIHQPEFQRLLSLQRRPRPTERQTDHLPRPEWRNHPLHHITRRVTIAVDGPLFVHLIAAGLDHLRRHGQVSVRQDHSVKSDLQVALPDEMPRLLIRFQMPAQHAASGEQRPAERLCSSQVTEYRVTDCRCRRGKIRLVQRTLQKHSGWHQLILRTYPWHQPQ